MKKLMLSLLLIVIVSTMALTSANSNNTVDESSENTKATKIITKRLNSGEIELKGNNGALIKTKLQLNNEGNPTILQVKLSNGQNAEIKITPEVASKKILQKLRLKNCDEAAGCTIELKEVGEGNKAKVIYEAKTKKTFRLFGLFRSEREIVTQIDTETGEEILTKRPWWSWMANEER